MAHAEDVAGNAEDVAGACESGKVEKLGQ